jgi:hypothetical protein
MREDFKNSLERLNTDAFAAICIEYKNALGGYTRLSEAIDGKREANYTKKLMIEKSGSVNAFFEDLIAKSLTDLRITNRKKNGSAFVSVGKPYECSLSAANEAKTTTPEPTPTQMQTPTTISNYPMQAQGLNGGLSGAEIFKVYNHDTIQNQNIEYKNKIENLEKEIKKLEIEVLKNELLGTKSVEKSKANNDLLEKLTPLLAPIIQKAMMPAGQSFPADAGLNSPAASPAKQQFMVLINQMDDAFIADVSKVAILMANNTAFDDKLTELVTQFSA